MASVRPVESLYGAQNVKYGPAPLTLPRSYGVLVPATPLP